MKQLLVNILSIRSYLSPVEIKDVSIELKSFHFLVKLAFIPNVEMLHLFNLNQIK
jgi:hypothetical protein